VHRAPKTQIGGRGRGKTRKVEVAEELCVLYHEAVRAEVATLTKGGHRMPSQTLDDVDESDRSWFLKAAVACLELEADAREFIVAQFAVWRAASTYYQKLLLPQPHHLGKLGARVRYLQHKVVEETRKSRVVTLDAQEDRKRFYVEERQLKGLARELRLDQADVLAGLPERFSRAFLEHKGAWAVVKDVWEERAR